MSQEPAIPPEASGLRHMLRTFRYRNYRLFFAGQGTSLIGTWMQRVATGWLAYRLTNSMFILGLVGFLTQFPTLLLAPLGGLLADRVNKRRLLILLQSLSMAQAMVLALLVVFGHVQVWHILVLTACLGAINAFDVPVRQSFIVEMVEKREDLGNAIALNSAMFNSARLIGPSVAGLLIATLGEGACFLLNGLSYSVIIIALLRMRLPERPREKARHQTALQGMKEGFAYAWGSPVIRYLLLFLALVSLLGLPYAVLAPVYARDILHGGPRTLGFIMSAVGVGALGGALFLASRKNVSGLRRIIPLAAAVFGLGLAAFAYCRILPLSLFFIMAAGFGMTVHMASTNTLLQTLTADDKRGRVMSLYSMAFMGTAPFGSLLAGWAAARVGAPLTLLTGGVVCLAGAVVFGRALRRA
ncbi:MAG: MFS transporter [Fibrobacterota bacterium]